jgi:O-antigen ligase
MTATTMKRTAMSPVIRGAAAPVPLLGEVLLWVLLAGTIVLRSAFAHMRIGPIYVTDGALFLLLALAILFYPHRFFAWGRIEKILVAYVGLCVLHTIAALEHGMWTLKDATLGGYALFALLVPVFISSWDRLERFGVVMCASVVGLAAYGLFLPDIGGNASFYLGAGALGLLAMLSFQMRWLAAVVFCLFLLEMILSGRRASAVALVVGSTALFVAIPVAARHRFLRVLVALAMCGSVVGLAALSVPSISARVEWGVQRYLSGTVGYRSDGTAQWRLGAWRNAVALIGAHPVRGVGFGTPINVYPVDEPPEKMASPYNYGLPHNTYLSVALKTGIPGLALLLTGLAAWFRRVWSMRPQSPWACGLAALGIYGCFYGYFALFFERPFMAMPFWILIGLGLALERLTAREPGQADTA